MIKLLNKKMYRFLYDGEVYFGRFSSKFNSFYIYANNVSEKNMSFNPHKCTDITFVDIYDLSNHNELKKEDTSKEFSYSYKGKQYKGEYCHTYKNFKRDTSSFLSFGFMITHPVNECSEIKRIGFFYSISKNVKNLYDNLIMIYM
jgi:hypothetical protein